MSPLLDITNVESYSSERIQETQNVKDTSREHEDITSDSGCISLPKSSANTGSSNVDSKCTFITRFKNRFKRTKKVQQQTNEWISEDASCSFALSPSLRVPPPHPGLDFVLKGLGSLSLEKPSPLDAEASNESYNSRHCLIQKPPSVSTLPDAPKESSKDPSGSSQQCTACKQSFASLSELTEHLFRHVYDGLLAAHWLNNAMVTLLPSSANNPSDSQVHSNEQSSTPHPANSVDL